MKKFFAVYNEYDEPVGTYDSYEELNKYLKKSSIRTLACEICRIKSGKIDYIFSDGMKYKVYLIGKEEE